MNISIAEGEYQFARYPETKLVSLQAWNAADELALSYLSELPIGTENMLLYEDTFGVMAIHLHDQHPQVIIQARSQAKAIAKNCFANNQNQPTLFELDSVVDPVRVATVKVPKSADLFELYLQHVHKNLAEGGIVVCSFMTKYFTQKLLDIASKYFHSAKQTKAKKKARLLILSTPKPVEHSDLVRSIPLAGYPNFRQFYGVFSSGNIDYGSQFLMESLRVGPDETAVLDLASGNGVLSAFVLKQNPHAFVHLVDDSWLAVESSKMNVPATSAQFYWNDCLENIQEQSIDLAISNPPFHFGHETNIEVSLSLFEQVHNCLKPKARFVAVANKHLNYVVHLRALFQHVFISNENEKFVVYECRK